MVEMLRTVGTWLIVGTALLAWAVVVVHHVLARWWQTEFGRHAFTFELVLALVLGLWAVRLVIPEGDWFQTVRLISFAGVPFALMWRLRILIKTWHTIRTQRQQDLEREA